MLPNAQWRAVEEVIEKRKIIYKPPLPRKKQRVTRRKGRNGPVKVFSREEIFLYQMRKMNERVTTL